MVDDGATRAVLIGADQNCLGYAIWKAASDQYAKANLD
jgi:hypothetical protein